MGGVNEELRAELLDLRAADQSIRQLSSDPSQEAMRAGWNADRVRAARLAEIVAEHGWPGRSLVGEDGTSAAWILAQHADDDHDLQERILELLQDAVARDEAPPSLAALLTDRVCVNRGRPQVYGTQFGGSGETYGPQPIADRAGLDERRSAVGLEPFERYERRMRELEAEHRAQRSPAMTEAERVGATTFAMPSEREIVVTRVFDAPRALVFDAWTKPDHITSWMLGPEGWTMPVCDVDLRPGGEWHFAWRSDAGRQLEMRGTYREVSPPARMAFTESWGGSWPDTLNTIELSEDEGRTSLTCTVLYVSAGAREAALSTGMKDGMAQSFDRLSAHLA